MNLGTQFRDVFQQALDSKSVCGLVLEFNIYRVDPRYKNYAFVEARNDAEFYNSTKLDILNTESCKYIYSERQETVGALGKKAVLQALKVISEDEKLNCFLENCIFIVDQDYDRKLEYTEVVLSQQQKKYVHLTKGYSFENFYFQRSNLRLLLDNIEFDSIRKRRAIDDMQSFIKDSVDYFAAKGTVSLCYRKYNLIIRDLPKNDEIFLFDFGNNNIVDKRKYKNAIVKLHSIIDPNEDMVKIYTELKNRIISDPFLYVRGHDLFDFWMAYIRSKGENIGRKQWKKINRDLIVELISF